MPVECSTCHALFSRRDAMMRHKRHKHGESDAEDEDVDMDHSPAHSNADNNEEKGNVIFRQMVEKAHEYTADEWQKKYDKYKKKENMPEKKANEKTREETYQQFRKLYEYFLYNLYRLQEGTTYTNMIEDIDEFQLEKYGLKKSIKMALNKNRHLLESYLDSSDEDEDEDDDDSEEKEEEENDQPMKQNRIPLSKRQPLEDKHIPVFKRT
jgi:hypothetical protein